jgi:hypothetical protein
MFPPYSVLTKRSICHLLHGDSFTQVRAFKIPTRLIVAIFLYRNTVPVHK